jgi:adenylate cyclase
MQRINASTSASLALQAGRLLDGDDSRHAKRCRFPTEDQRMSTEIERKFLVHERLLPALPSPTRLTQGYLSFEPEVRIRADAGGNAWLTVKGSGAIARPEAESTIEFAPALDMLDMCAAKLVKVRHVLPAGNGRRWEVDFFAGHLRGLWLAEIELGTEDEVFVKPAWLGQEVTYDPRFKNAALARATSIPKPRGPSRLITAISPWDSCTDCQDAASSGGTYCEQHGVVQVAFEDFLRTEETAAEICHSSGATDDEKATARAVCDAALLRLRAAEESVQ